jgi:hypothetical protein
MVLHSNSDGRFGLVAAVSVWRLGDVNKCMMLKAELGDIAWAETTRLAADLEANAAETGRNFLDEDRGLESETAELSNDSAADSTEG